MIDVGFIMGAAGSSNSTDFASQQFIVYKIISNLKLIRNGPHAGVILYGNNANIAVRLGAYRDSYALQSMVTALNNPGDGHRLDKALRIAKDSFFKMINGGRDNAKKVLVVLTNGKSGQDPLLVGSELKDQGIKVISIGVGHNPDVNEVKKLATSGKDAMIAPTAEDNKPVAIEAAKRILPGKLAK